MLVEPGLELPLIERMADRGMVHGQPASIGRFDPKPWRAQIHIFDPSESLRSPRPNADGRAFTGVIRGGRRIITNRQEPARPRPSSEACGRSVTAAADAAPPGTFHLRRRRTRRRSERIRRATRLLTGPGSEPGRTRRPSGEPMRRPAFHLRAHLREPAARPRSEA